MKIFGLEIRRAKALSPVADWRHGWRVISEPFTGAWQSNQEEKVGDLSCYPTLYACLSRLSQDIGKLPFCLKREEGGIWNPVDNPAYSPVLRKPNSYQTAQQFRESWILSKLMNGNAYILKQRDNRNIVTALYVLDPCRVVPMVSESGSVFYQLNYSTPQNLLPASYPAEQLIIPASEIIHDRINCLHHHLIGVPPMCAAYWPAAKNLRILRSSAEFFANNAQPGGILTAPAGMSEDDAKEVKEFWEENYGGTSNAGRVAVIGADMKFTSFAMKSADSQLVEQMRYSDEQICQPFGIPPFKIGIGQPPAGMKVDDINQLYYSDALQGHIESMENLLDEGLRISRPEGVELDLEPLLRMDVGKQADVETKLVGGKIKTPNESRKRFGLPSTGGGDTLWGQHQDYPLGVLAERNDLNPISEAPAPAPADAAEDDQTEEVRRLRAELWQRKALEATREAIHA